MTEATASVEGKVRRIIARSAAEDLSEGGTESVLEELLACGDWPSVREGIFEVLRGGAAELRPEALRLIYLLQGRGHPMEADRTIALLYTCMERDDELDANLVWTIARSLKRVPYLADYDPYQDEDVSKEMSRLRSG